MSDSSEIGRQLFHTLPVYQVVLFYVVAILSMSTFAYGIWRRVAKYRAGKPAARLQDIGARLLDVVKIMGDHRRLVRNNRLVGLAHAGIFFGFVLLFIGTALITLDSDVLGPISSSLRFWYGNFYLAFSLVLDLAGAGLLLGLLFMASRRWLKRPATLNYARPDRGAPDYDRRAYRHDDALFVGLLLAVGLTGFLNEAVRIQMTRPPHEVWSVVGWKLADLLEVRGLTSARAIAVYPQIWWFHALLALGFIAYLPYAKSVHMLVSLASLATRDKTAGKALPDVPDEGEIGYATVADFSWVELLQLDACTKCGRCHDACPARAGGFPLSPRDFVLELRENADATLRGKSLFHERSETAKTAMGVKPETIWSCTTCLACVDICPVGVEHVPLMVQLRRRLVEDGNMESNIQRTLEKIVTTGNSFGLIEDDRSNWTDGLNFELSDARKEEVDCLWFVGDYASFDPRIQKITQSAARVFASAGLDFGILFESERNAGNDVRRIGEEGLFQYLVEQNLKTLSEAKFKRIITTDPHSYNTLKNEYTDLAVDVLHHTELLAELFEAGKIEIRHPVGHRVTYHDPCHLSRYNQVTEAPRSLLKALGVDLAEMPRTGANSFCCGAGGGRIWSTAKASGKRPSEQRIEEALGVGGVKKFVTACPKCNVMHSEALKSVGAEKELAVVDIVELVEEAIFGLGQDAQAYSVP